MSPSMDALARDEALRAMHRKSREDMCPIYDSKSQKSLWMDITDWLREMEVDDLTLTSITTESFCKLFERLVYLADPSQSVCFPSAASSHWGKDFVTTLSHLKYPHIHNVSPQWVYDPAEPRSIWPYLLSVLCWLMNMGKVRIGFLSFGTHAPIADPQRLWNSPLLFRYDYWDAPENDCTYAYPPDLKLEPTYASWKASNRKLHEYCARQAEISQELGLLHDLRSEDMGIQSSAQ